MPYLVNTANKWKLSVYDYFHLITKETCSLELSWKIIMPFLLTNYRHILLNDDFGWLNWEQYLFESISYRG